MGNIYKLYGNVDENNFVNKILCGKLKFQKM